MDHTWSVHAHVMLDVSPLQIFLVILCSNVSNQNNNMDFTKHLFSFGSHTSNFDISPICHTQLERQRHTHWPWRTLQGRAGLIMTQKLVSAVPDFCCLYLSASAVLELSGTRPPPGLPDHRSQFSTAQLSVQRADQPGLKVDLCLVYPLLEL